MTNETIVTPTGRRVVLAGLLAALCIAAYRVLEPFLEPLLWAAILAYVSWPLYVRLQKPLRGYATVSALLMTVALIAALLLPMLFLARTLAEELMIAYGAISLRLSAGPPELPQLVRELPWLGERLTELFRQYAADPTWLRTELGHWVNRFSGELANIAGGVGRNVLKAGLVVIILFFFYRDGAALVDQIRYLAQQFLRQRAISYFDAVGATIKAVVNGLLLTAIAQGLLAGIGYAVAGVRAPILFGLITTLFALIPFGTPLVWGSIVVWLLAAGEYGAGIGLLLWGTLVVSTIDNVIRPLVISSATRVHFLMVLLGVLGGAIAFGFAGLVVGPVILAVVSAVWVEATAHKTAIR